MGKIDLSINKVGLAHNIQKAKENNVIIPTIAQMQNPDLIPEKIKAKLSHTGLWDVDPVNLFRISWHNEAKESGGLFQAVRKVDEDGTDYGYVGEIKKVNPEPVIDMLDAGYIPVISTVAQGIDEDTGYNINADLAASKLAVALQAEKLILLTDVRGLLLDRHDESTLLPEVKVSGVPKLIKDGVIAGGMIPKVDCCVEAVREGVRRANIQDGRVAHSILIELFSDNGVGTMFY